MIFKPQRTLYPKLGVLLLTLFNMQAYTCTLPVHFEVYTCLCRVMNRNMWMWRSWQGAEPQFFLAVTKPSTDQNAAWELGEFFVSCLFYIYIFYLAEFLRNSEVLQQHYVLTLTHGFPLSWAIVNNLKCFVSAKTLKTPYIAERWKGDLQKCWGVWCLILSFHSCWGRILTLNVLYPFENFYAECVEKIKFLIKMQH